MTDFYNLLMNSPAMVPKIQTSVTLFGKFPWGFTVAGGKQENQPLVVSEVRVKVCVFIVMC